MKFHEVEVRRSLQVMHKERDWPTRMTFDYQFWSQSAATRSLPPSCSPSQYHPRPRR
ncbi:hypothetical protein KSP39_PZI012486 [Platanthera zijinensis]|uniref:Uncharacterized protein n=1 Tax=Platanthera zijinensis TaxID=2320716 RepID=A0AAP0BEV6_9ASPA